MSNQYAQNSLSEKTVITDSDVPVIDSALSHANLKTLAVRTSSSQGVTLVEMPMTGLLILRTRKEQTALAAALKSTMGLDLPGVLSAYTTDNQMNKMDIAPCVRWISPDEWLLSCSLQDAFGIETDLRKQLGNGSIAVVNVSGGFAILKILGTNAIDVLKKSTGYDVHPLTFTSGKVVNTVFAKAQVTLSCVDIDHYELIVRRSFADYMWHWIQVASAEYGLNIEVELK